MPSVLVLQHSPCETLGTIAQALEFAGVETVTVRTFLGDPVPADTEGVGGLVLMGGPMGVYEDLQFPFLKEEMRLIGQALEARKPVLGVCLGSQLLAAALGAKVTKGRQKELGWHTVMLTEQAQADSLWAGAEPAFTAFHWHGDIFELPRGASLIASSLLTPHQAFRYGGNAYGFLFHIEVTDKIVRRMLKAFPQEMKEAGGKEAEIIRGIGKHLPPLQRIGRMVFRRWAALLIGEGEMEDVQAKTKRSLDAMGGQA